MIWAYVALVGICIIAMLIGAGLYKAGKDEGLSMGLEIAQQLLIASMEDAKKELNNIKGEKNE